jgi:hypothetical protein
MSTDKATERPWRFVPGYDNCECGAPSILGTIEGGGKGFSIARIWSDQPNAEADANFTIKAVNLFDDLVKVLEDILWELPLKKDWLDPDLERFARAILAKAKEE